MVIWMKHKVSCIVWCLIFCLNPFRFRSWPFLLSHISSQKCFRNLFFIQLCHKTNHRLWATTKVELVFKVSRGQIGKRGLITLYCVTKHYIHKVAGSLCHELLHFVSRPLQLYTIHTTNTGYYFRISNHLKCMRKRDNIVVWIVNGWSFLCIFYWVCCNGCKGILFCLLIGPG